MEREMKNKISFLVTLLMGVGLTSFAHAYTEACFTDSNGNFYRGEIVETYYNGGIDYADIHWLYINGAPDYQNRATALPFGEFYACNSLGRATIVAIEWFAFARPVGIPIYVRYEPHYYYNGVVYHEYFPEHRIYRPVGYHVTINHTTVIRPAHPPVRPVHPGTVHGRPAPRGGGHHH